MICFMLLNSSIHYNFVIISINQYEEDNIENGIKELFKCRSCTDLNINVSVISNTPDYLKFCLKTIFGKLFF